MLPKFLNGVRTAADILTGPPSSENRWAQILGLLCLYLGGLAAWGRFVVWGKLIPGGDQVLQLFHDWGWITVPRLVYLKQAVTEAILPLHVFNDLPLNLITTRFLAVPDQILSPQIILLRFLDPGQFTVLQIGLTYTLGFIGLIFLQRKFNLSLLVVTVFFLLFNFNGHVLAHFSVGHLTWGGYFLFTWLVLFILEVIQESGRRWQHVAKISILLFLILLQGSYHQFVYLLFLLGILVVMYPQKAWTWILAGSFSLLLSLARLAPSFLLVSASDRLPFLKGYPDLQSILSALTTIQKPDGLLNTVGNWESTLFIGVLGAAFLLYFGLYRPLFAPGPSTKLRWLVLPSLILAFISLENVFLLVLDIVPLPPFTGERVSNRIISVGFVILLLIACMELQHWLETQRGKWLPIAGLIGLILFEVHDLYVNFTTWSWLSVIDDFPPNYFDPATYVITNHYEDIYYLALLAGGLLVTIASAAFLVWKVVRESSKVRQSSFAPLQYPSIKVEPDLDQPT